MPHPFTRAITTKTTTTPIHISGCNGRVGICFGSSIGVVIGRSIERSGDPDSPATMATILLVIPTVAHIQWLQMLRRG